MMNAKHKSYGAAIYNITQHPGYTSLARLDDRSHLVNGNKVVFFKLASKPKNQNAYQFTFPLNEVGRIEDLKKRGEVLLALICVYDEVVCCLPYFDFERLWLLRQEQAGDLENNFWLKVQLCAGKSLRVIADYPGRRRTYLTSPKVVHRSDFPSKIFNNVPSPILA